MRSQRCVAVRRTSQSLQNDSFFSERIDLFRFYETNPKDVSRIVNKSEIAHLKRNTILTYFHKYIKGVP